MECGEPGENLKNLLKLNRSAPAAGGHNPGLLYLVNYGIPPARVGPISRSSKISNPSVIKTIHT